jgi:hypothetical protein
MKNSFLINLSFLLIASIGFAQKANKYSELTGKAKTYYENKEYKRSANTYSQAFRSNSGKAYYSDRYNAACAWTLAGNKDSAFYQLFKVANAFKYDNYDRLSKDSVLSSLNKDPRWDELLNIVKQNIGQDEARLNKSLVILLDSVYHDDQSYRFKQISIDKEFGPGSPERKAIRKIIHEKDSINSMIVTDLIDKYGWIGKEAAGGYGNSTLALVLQHSNINVQKKYLPLMREALKNKKADPDDLAILEDKVALAEQKKQIFGSQLISFDGKNYHFLPIEDPENIDKRRTELGLNTMDEYVRNWGLRWDLKKYEEDLKLLEKEKVNY